MEGRERGPQGTSRDGGAGGTLKLATFSRTSLGFQARELWGPLLPQGPVSPPPSWRLPGIRPYSSCIPPMEQCLEHNRCLIIDGGHRVSAPHTQAESNGAPMKCLSRDFSPSPQPAHPTAHSALWCGSRQENAGFLLFSHPWG